MKYFIGIDLGTSAMKLLLTDSLGTIHKEVTKEYPLYFPKPGWSEQSPEDWWDALVNGMKELLTEVDPTEVAGIGTAGQMHGLVVLDKEDQVIRKTILWNDARTAGETDYLNNVIGKSKLSELTANIAFAGFTAPKLLWMKANEPENFEKISKIMLPKDYINYLLTGVHATDYSDASGFLLLDVKNRCWSEEMLQICGVTKEQMPALYESFAPIGKLTQEAANALGLTTEVVVAAGAGDNAAAAVGTGTIGEGKCNISLGTSGTVFMSSKHFGVDKKNALHAFCHADGGYHLMGVVLSAASCNKWFCDGILQTKDYVEEQKDISDDKLGCNHVYFLPYLMGERSPINDTDASGTFIGMRMDTGREQMLQAVLEGVAFAVRDSVEVARELGLEIKSSGLCGGGAKSKLWRKIMANVLNIELEIPVSEQGPGYGGAILAMVACGEYADVKMAADRIIKIASVVKPDPAIVARYEEQYAKFRQIYPALKDLYKKL